ncbi:4'-phosphopantetheinyl transferase family protein [Streptomyces albireticuli]|uniref:4'-phosphopantetheinyl transferase n=1 Tax=Streptomyces albireticuli TaxID=1940 RepID=A0A2A2DG51_9ACTN|nr:4'-phosphopantetheinyl transferase superfamily protein [Streptomyces albireticuli]MCD9145218.1 4'-phosphopantetheinyl transferase superfamily protein [Streptomyces albireticuli]MCD9164607.1 4'-phosphopantetheinyl transferase superfamily protein [Streptomyces albireticuli]MCD9194872.1 4'-phosphopantetheinyl transferase superfamily protein [Streptomyces albireticuli]PAU50514.1 4'-phosphopantetheinyl transferase [Streptomyces albireticuli]
MIERILPGPVVTEETFADPAGAADALFPEEAAVVARAVPKRQREFTTVRLCARKALGRLGHPPAPLLPSRRGAPQWPAGVVGSMTHCEGYRAAVVARAADATSIGIDAEPNGPLPEGVLESIALPAERAWVRALAARRPEVSWDRLLFSAKESVFKTWYPLTGRELDFVEAELEADPDAGTFSARLLVPGPVVGGRRLDGFTGRWLADRGLVVTAIALEASPAPSDGSGGAGGGLPGASAHTA